MSARDRARKARREAARSTPEGVRLQRVLADAGVAARRACEAMIEEGRVSVNGRRVRRLPVFVDPDRDRITVDGRPLPRRLRHLYLMVHKPERVLGSTSDEPGADRRSVVDLVHHPDSPRLFPVGRLDYESRGLVLLTNDGELANRLTHPRYGIPKAYEVVVRGAFGPEQQAGVERELGRLARRTARRRVGLSAGPAPRPEPPPQSGESPRPSLLEGGAGRASVRVAKREGANTVLHITLLEGRNRQLPEILRAAGCTPRRVTRIGIGPLELRGLAVGAWRELTRDELRALRRASARGEAPHAPPQPERAPTARRAGPKTDERPPAPAPHPGAVRDWERPEGAAPRLDAPPTTPLIIRRHGQAESSDTAPDQRTGDGRPRPGRGSKRGPRR
ncbi:MAG: rRNA pseudouridine synthase [Phycisphaerae bacterium]|nr:rRNA pseudouridine synthase [Phycisphaerae bacterium]